MAELRAPQRRTKHADVLPSSAGTAATSSVLLTDENADKPFDLDVTSKWSAGQGQPTGLIPADWQLQGSDDGLRWAVVQRQQRRHLCPARRARLYAD